MKSRDILSPESRILNSSEFPIGDLISAFKSFKFGIATVDRHLRLRLINTALAEMNNLPPEAHIDKPLHEIVGSLFTRLAQSYECVFTTEQPLPNVYLSGQLPTRSDPGQWLNYFFPLVDTRGRVVEVGVFVIEMRPCSQLQSYIGPLGIQNVVVPPNSGLMSNLDRSGDSDLASPRPTDDILSGRERQVLGLLAAGKSNKEISSVLAISVKTVETYRSRVMLKIGAPSLIHLVHYAIRHRIVDLQK